MSVYGWERGTIKLPTKEFTSLKKELISRMEERMKTLHFISLVCYEEIRKVKPKNKEDFLETIRSYNQLSFHEQFQIQKSLLKDNKLKKPKKNDFLLDKKKLIFDDNELRVSLDQKTKNVHYSSDDGKDSIDYARESFLGKTILTLLDRVKFSTQTGGYLRTQTEYDVDSGTGARVSKTFGKYKTNKKLAKELYGF